MKIFLSTVLLSFSVILQAQEPVISAVEFRGNEVTMERVLEREIVHPTGVALDSTLAENGRIRLVNLGLFLSVEWYTEPVDANRDLLVYELVESFRIFPAIIPLYSEETGWGLLFSVSMVNFRGLNETVSLNGRIGRLSSLRFSIFDPWVYGDHGSLSFEAANEKFNHIFLPVTIRTREIGASTGRYWGYKFRGSTGLSVSHKMIHDKNEIPRDTLYFTNAFISGTVDTRDIYNHPSRGFLYTATVRHIGDLTGKGRNSFYIYNSLSLYGSIGRAGLVLGFNIEADLAFLETEHIFTRSIGGSYSVRGWGFPDRQAFTAQPFRFGHQLITSSVELRKGIRLPWDYFNNPGLEAVAFADIGMISNEISGLANSSGLSGTGIGIRVNFPVVQVIRLDYAWGFYRGELIHRGFHLGFGQKF